MLKFRTVTALMALILVAACSEKTVILEGERLALRPEAPAVADPEAPAPDMAFAAPPAAVNADWTHVAGGPTHLAGHPALSAAPSLIWSQDIGQGNSRRHRITADPVVAEGKIFTLDSRARVTAVSTAGETIWSRDLTPPTDRADDASGGGVAYADGRVFVTTGFGAVAALDPASGAVIWNQRLDAPATAAPTVLDGLVYVVSRDNVAWAIDAGNGRVKWQLPGTPTASGITGGASPAVNGQVAIFPFGSGELVAALRQGGVRLWGAPITGKRAGRPYALISDISADPVIEGDVIYTGNPDGRTVALSLNSGTRIWTAREGALGPVAVAGGSVFLISDQNDLVRLDAATGETLWKQELRFFRRDTAKRAKAIYAYFGPVLAGGNLWVAADDGTMQAFDPATGSLKATVDVPAGAASSMAVAGGTMYLVNGRGQLLAFR